MSERRRYKIKAISVNGIRVREVIISNHYQENHLKYMNDDLILKLVNELDGRREIPVAEKEGFSYFVTLVEHSEKPYKLVWLLEEGAIYIGVVNAHRTRKKR